MSLPALTPPLARALAERNYDSLTPVQLAVLAGGGVSQRVARDSRARLTIAQPPSAILDRQWRFSQGELTSPRGR